MAEWICRAMVARQYLEVKGRIYVMKTTLITTLLGLAAFSIQFAAPLQGQNQTIPVAIVDSGTELAQNYANAFQVIHRVPVTMILQRGDKTQIRIVDVRKVVAHGSILVVTDGEGITYLINPRDVVCISDRQKWEH